MMSVRFRFALPIAFGALGVAAAQWHEPPRTTFDSVYNASQATRGKDKFTLVCLSCHDMDEHKAILREVWIGKPLAEFFNYLVTEMPSGDPGTLSPQEYSDVTAYILQLNGMPAGEAELPHTADSLASIRIDTLATAKDSTAMPKDTVTKDTVKKDTVKKDTVATDTTVIDTIGPERALERAFHSRHVPAWLRGATASAH